MLKLRSNLKIKVTSNISLCLTIHTTCNYQQSKRNVLYSIEKYHSGSNFKSLFHNSHSLLTILLCLSSTGIG